VLGDRYRTGLACDENIITPNLAFYTEDMFVGAISPFHAVFG
jgi:hypothetical protein